MFLSSLSLRPSLSLFHFTECRRSLSLSRTHTRLLLVRFKLHRQTQSKSALKFVFRKGLSKKDEGLFLMEVKFVPLIIGPSSGSVIAGVVFNSAVRSLHRYRKSWVALYSSPTFVKCFGGRLATRGHRANLLLVPRYRTLSPKTKLLVLVYQDVLLWCQKCLYQRIGDAFKTSRTFVLGLSEKLQPFGLLFDFDAGRHPNGPYARTRCGDAGFLQVGTGVLPGDGAYGGRGVV